MATLAEIAAKRMPCGSSGSSTPVGRVGIGSNERRSPALFFFLEPSARACLRRPAPSVNSTKVVAKTSCGKPGSRTVASSVRMQSRRMVGLAGPSKPATPPGPFRTRMEGADEAVDARATTIVVGSLMCALGSGGAARNGAAREAPSPSRIRPERGRGGEPCVTRAAGFRRRGCAEPSSRPRRRTPWRDRRPLRGRSRRSRCAEAGGETHRSGFGPKHDAIRKCRRDRAGFQAPGACHRRSVAATHSDAPAQGECPSDTRGYSDASPGRGPANAAPGLVGRPI